MKVQRAGRAATTRRRARALDFEDDRTFARVPRPAAAGRATTIFSCAAHRATAELDELSAGCGIGLFALVWGGKGSLIARNLLGGTGRLPAALGRELGDRARTGCRVDAIRARRRRAVVVRADGEEIRARHVIVAAQAPHAAPLVAPVAERAAAALAQLTYGAFLSVAVETSETTRDALRRRLRDGHARPRRSTCSPTRRTRCARGGPRRPGGSLMLFAGAHAAAALMREPDEVIVERFLADLHDALSADPRRDRRRDRAALGARQRLRAPRPRAACSAPLEGALGAHENLHLAGDYFAELGNMEAAARTGLAAAERVDAAPDHSER